MLNELFPKKSTRYVALPLLAQVADDYTRGYRGRGIGDARGVSRRVLSSGSIVISGAGGIDSGRA